MDTPEQYDSLALAAEAGRRVLEAGSETYRAEEIVTHLCRAWCFSDVECFAIPTGVIASATDETGESRSVVRRIHRRSVDLNRIAAIAAAVTRTERESLSPESFRRELDRLEASEPYPPLVKVLAAGICAGFFALLFGGVWRDAVAAFLVGMAIRAATVLVGRRDFPDFIVNLIGGAVASVGSELLVRAGLAANLDKTVIGSIMLLVPGLATVNAIRDTIAGDLVAGTARLADAFMTAAALSLGAGIGLALLRMVGL